MPQPTGANPAKSRFFAEAAAAFELLALWHQLTAEEQVELRAHVAGLAAAATTRSITERK